MKSTVRIAVAIYAYGGNGGVSSVIPELMVWWGKAYNRLLNDPRVETVVVGIYSDTPVYMTRNLAVREAKEAGCDMLLMLDSDNEPDAYYGKDPSAKLFLDEAFTFAFDRLKQGIPTVIAAPYCGPPPHPINRPGISDGGEVPYLFQWTNVETNGLDSGWKQEMLTRREAEKLAGIHPMSSLPTGCCLFTTNIFDGPPKPFFDYEHDKDKCEKRGTEDCFATRNLSVYWKIKKGYDVCFAACNSWALHNKPKRVGKPRVATLEIVAEEMREALNCNTSIQDEKRIVDYTSNLPDHIGRRGQTLRHDQNEVYLSPEDLEEARVLMEREKETGSQYADVKLDNEPIVTNGTPPLVNTHAEMAGVENSVAIALEKQNGHALKHRIVGGYKVAAIPTEISNESIDNIAALTNWLVEKNDGPIEVAVAHAGSGQSAAAILEGLPEGSHLYALDSTLTYQFSTEPAEQFAKSFQHELESGRVMADLSGRKFPYPEDQHHLDLVFIERSLTEEKLETWFKHITEGGLLAGLGYETPKLRRMVDEFAENNGYKLRASGDVWAIPK